MAIPRPAPGQGKWWALTAVGVAVMTVLAVWWGLSASRGVSWQDAGYQVVSDQRVDVRFDVINQAGKPVQCTLQALDIKHAQVGYTTVDLPASTFDSTRYTRTVRTVSKAVTGTVIDCSYK